NITRDYMRKGSEREQLFIAFTLLISNTHPSLYSLVIPEFIKISQAVAMGFLVMGFIGFFVKLIHIPINNILVYVSSFHHIFIYIICFILLILLILLIFLFY